VLLHILLCAAAVAAASEAPVPVPDAAAGQAGAPAAVLRIDGPDVFVDLGRGSGARPGERVRVSRPVRVFRPGAREPLVDRFAVGEVELVEVGEVLARARPDAALAQKLRLGDVVEPLRPLAREAPRRGEARAAPAPDDGFREAWLAAQTLPPERRAIHWEAYLAAHRDGALEEPLRREIAALRAARAAAAPRADPVRAPVVSAPARAFEGDPLEVVLSFADPSAATPPRAAVLNWRPSGETLYHPLAFAAEGATWRARLPADAARAPGAEFWVGVVDASGVEQAVAGSGRDPRVVGVRELPGRPPEPRPDRSVVELRSDYADWNHLKGNDHHAAFEGDYLYRVLGFVHAVKLGLGTYQGVGESLQHAIEDERAAGGGPVRYRSRTVGYDYAFTEVDLRAADALGFVVRALAGVNRDGIGAGVEGKVRIGRDPGTHLLASAGFTRGIGNRNELTLAWDQVRGWPMAASVIVTNEPVQEDYGVRFVYQVGRALAPWADLSLRAGYELRDINHSGFGLGLAGTFHW
jgi:hypothetical protein